MLEAFIALAGTIVGLNLNEISSIWRERGKSKQEENSVYILISVETYSDVKSLSDFGIHYC